MVDALAGEARAAAAGEDGQPATGRDADRVADVGGGAREDDGDRLHLVDGGIGGVEQAVGPLDAHIAGATLQPGGQLGGERAQGGIAAVEQRQGGAHRAVRAGRRTPDHVASRRG